MMTGLEVAMEYLRSFRAGDIRGIEPLLASDLKKDPPEKCGYQVLSITENEDSVAVFYKYEKPDQVVQLAQLFKFRNQQICEILLVFDGRF